jgi:hypothetical protein
MKLFNVTIKKRLAGIDRVQQTVTKAMKTSVDDYSNVLADQIREEYFRSSFGTYKRGSALERSIKPLPARVSGDYVVGGISIGAGLPYAENFVTDESTVTIKPTNRKHLAIPLSKEADALQRAHPNLKRLKLYRRGSLLFRQDPGPERTKHTRGRKPKVENRGLSPFFVLRSSVTIHPKIHPSDIAAQYVSTFTQAVRREVRAMLA